MWDYRNGNHRHVALVHVCIPPSTIHPITQIKFIKEVSGHQLLVLGTDSRSSGRAASASNHGVISPALPWKCFQISWSRFFFKRPHLTQIVLPQSGTGWKPLCGPYLLPILLSIPKKTIFSGCCLLALCSDHLREWTTHSVQWEPVCTVIAWLTQDADAVKVSYLWCVCSKPALMCMV